MVILVYILVGGVNLKKIFLIVTTLIIIVFGLVAFFKDKQQQEDPMILTELADKGYVNGKREFIFTLTNVGENKAKLEFPTWLEYNIMIGNLDNIEIPSGEIIMEHLDLNENNKEGRMLVLETNEKINYRVLISKIPKGNYEIIISSATGFGGIQKQEFSVD